MATFFSDYFRVDPKALEKHGAFDVSLITDLPLFIDPFLLFNSKKSEYRRQHDEIIRYLVFLRNKALAGSVPKPLLEAWYCFPEVRQTWLGFCKSDNQGHGLGLKFAVTLHESLHTLFPEFGNKGITRGNHLEKVCLIRDGVGRDNISDFATNLVKSFLCSYTEKFALASLREDQRRLVSVASVSFNFETEVWEPATFALPWINDDYVILTPKDLLTRDENWINKGDLVRHFEQIPVAIPDDRLRAQVNNYFNKALVRPKNREPNQTERAEAAVSTILKFPVLIDYYIRDKERGGDRATSISSQRVRFSEMIFIGRSRELQSVLSLETKFYRTPTNSYDEAHARLAYLKDAIENKGCHRIFYVEGKPIEREQDLQVMYRLVWYGTPSDVSREVNDGRGPADFKISRGARDKTIVEMKLAKNNHLKANLQKQAEIYQQASDAKRAIKAIIFFSAQERVRVLKILKEVGLINHKDVVLIDARADNKPSGSKARAAA